MTHAGLSPGVCTGNAVVSWDSCLHVAFPLSQQFSELFAQRPPQEEGNTCAFIFTGIAVGHIYYFLEDVFPNQPGGKKLLLTPGFL